jgi:hypothetical protein
VWEIFKLVHPGTDFSLFRIFPYLLAYQPSSVIMELGPSVPDIPLWEPSAAVTPVTAISMRVVGQVAQSVVEVSSLIFVPVPSSQVYQDCCAY